MTRPDFKYFKVNKNHPIIQSLFNEWKTSREQRNDKLKAIFASIPFENNGSWLGHSKSALGITIPANSQTANEIKQNKSYKTELTKDNMLSVSGDGRTKLGKSLNKYIDEIRAVLSQYDEFDEFMVLKLKLKTLIHNDSMFYMSACGMAGEYFLISIPYKTQENRFEGDNLPIIPDYFEEIKHWEFERIIEESE